MEDSIENAGRLIFDFIELEDTFIPNDGYEDTTFQTLSNVSFSF